MQAMSTSYQTPCFEGLEPRLLLTTLVGGDVFEYMDASGGIVRVALNGDLIVELIAADIDDQNQPLLGDMPGEITGSALGRAGTEILGGIGGADGIELIGPIVDYVPSAGTEPPVVIDLPEEFSIDGLATADAVGNAITTGFTVADEDGVQKIRLLELSASTNSTDVSANTLAFLQFATLKDDAADLRLAGTPTPLPDTPGGFAVNPNTGAAYCVEGDGLYEVNRITGEYQARVQLDDGGVNTIGNVQAMEFKGNDLYLIGQLNGAGAFQLCQVTNFGTGQCTTQSIQLAASIPATTVLQQDPPITALAFDASGKAQVVASLKEGTENPKNWLMDLDLTSGDLSNQQSLDLGTTNLTIHGMAWTKNLEGNDILIGVDRSQEVNNNPAPRLVQILNNGLSVKVFSQAGECANVKGLSSYTEAVGQAPTLYAATMTQRIRGSAVSLSVNGEDGTSRVISISGADFAPTAVDGLLYFVARHTVTLPSGDDVERDTLYRIDVNAENLSAVQNSLERVGTSSFVSSADSSVVTSIAWEQNGATYTLYGYRTIEGAEGTEGQIVTISTTTGAATRVSTVTLNSNAVTDITAIEFTPDDPAAPDVYLRAVSGNQLLRVTVLSGNCYVLGGLTDPDDEDDPIRGNNITGISWDPLRYNPFTGELGVLLGVDGETDELVLIDHRPRFPTADAFALYVAQSSSNGSISIARVPPVDEEDRPMQPYEGSVGSLRIHEAQENELIVISAPASTGQVYIGALSEDLDPDNDEDDLLPLISGNLYDDAGVNLIELGVRAKNVDDNIEGNTVSAGLVLAESLLEYVSTDAALQDRLLGQNLDNVQELVINNTGDEILVVDSDLKNASGATIASDQIAVVDPTTAEAAAPVDVTDSLLGDPLSGIGGLAYGDFDGADWLTGTQQLYAIYEAANPSPNLNLGDFSGYLPDVDIQDLTVTRGGVAYAVNDNAGTLELIRVTFDDAGLVDTVVKIGDIETAGSTAITDISAIEADPLEGTLYITGRLGGAGNQILFTVSATSGIATRVNAANDLYADATAMKGLAFKLVLNATGGIDKSLWGVARIGGVDMLYEIDLAAGTAGVGAAIVAGVAVNIKAMDFLQEGNIATRLMAIDTAGGGRIIQIDTAAPGASAVYSTTVDAGLEGYACDRNGYFYSIQAGVAPDQIWRSPGMISLLGKLDATTGVFERVGFLQNGTTFISGVKTMAFLGGPSSLQPTRDALYVVDVDNNLWEINAATGAIVSTSYSLEKNPGTPDAEIIGIESIAFDVNKVLYGYDRNNGRLVDIALGALQPFGAPAGTLAVAGSVYTTDGSMRPTVGGLTYDATNDRFLTVDNSTGSAILSDENSINTPESSALMALKGYTRTSATAQNINSVLIGGALSGRVNVSGNVDDTFYAGWLITGDTRGVLEESFPVAPFNDCFTVGGDLRNLVVNSSIGTNDDSGMVDPSYVTGFELEVTGKIGQVWALQDFIGSMHVENVVDYDVTHDDALANQKEIEFYTDEDFPEGFAFQNFELYRANGAFANDTFETAQYLGNMGISAAFPDDWTIKVVGVVQGDAGGEKQDYYGVALTAGQVITVQCVGLAVGVFDPDGRLIATDRNDVNLGATSGQEFRFTADRPGVYRFAVGMTPFDNSQSVDADAGYTLYITGTENMAVGAVKAGNNIFNNGSVGEDPIFLVDRGDLGALSAGQLLIFDNVSGNDDFVDIWVDDGDLRTLEAASIGSGGEDDAGLGYEASNYPIVVVSGDVGLIQATGTGEEDGLGIGSQIGGNFQLIDAAGFYYGILIADGGLGVLRAGSMASTTPSQITLNTDGVGDDGIIDLIDVEGDLGTLAGGGPTIQTGPNGDVRYMRVGGAIFQDGWYGGGTYSGETLNPGQNAVIRDDSGGYINIQPVYMTTDPETGEAIDPTTGEAPETEDLPVLWYRTYGIRGSGGSVLVDVSSTGSFRVGASSNGVGSPVQIGKITVNGAGRPVVMNGANVELTPSPSEDYSTDLMVWITGSTANPIDVFEIVGGNFTGILNETGGEIVNVRADSIDSLYCVGSIGLPKNTFGVAVNPRVDLVATNDFVPDGYPFNQQHVGVVVNGHLRSITSKASIGNVMVNGQIDWVRPNFDRAVNIYDGVFNGLAAPIYATGDICMVYIGEGIAPTGSGWFAHAGVFSEAKIRLVTSQFSGGDIRGAVVGHGGVGGIVLTNGSIINADILGSTLPSARECLPIDQTKIFTGDVGGIAINGNGGIIGAYIAGQNVGNIIVNGGFGFFNSFVSTIGGNAQIGNTTVDGFGIHDVSFNAAGGDQGNITATGRGAVGNPKIYSSTVRYGETETWLPGWDQRISSLNDIYDIIFAGWNDRLGLLERVIAIGNGNLGTVSGYRIIGSSQFNFANSIRGFQTYPVVLGDTTSINWLFITTGSLGFFNPTSDVNGLRMTIAGRILSMTIRGSLLGTSSITAAGPNGHIYNLTIAGNLEGDVTADGIIGTITVGGNMTGDIVVAPILPVALSLNRLTINGSYTGSLDVQGNVGTISVGSNFGNPGDTLQINGNLGTLSVGARLGGGMALDLNVLGSVTTMSIVGPMTGNAWISGNLRTANFVTAAGFPVTGNLTVMGTLTSLSLAGGGDWDSTLTAGNSLGTVTITGANLTKDGSIICSTGNINLVYLRGGNLNGTVSAPNGTINQILVIGAHLGEESHIQAEQVNYLRVDGFIQSGAVNGARIDVDNELRTIWVGGSVGANAAISMGFSRSVTIMGSLNGALTFGNYAGLAVFRIGGDVKGDLTIQADTSLTIGGSITDDASVHIGYDLALLRVTNINNGNLFVDGEIRTIIVTTIEDGVITAGRDIGNLTVLGSVTRSLIQAGINRGDDDDFATLDNNGSQISRMGQIKRLQVNGNVINSIINAGGHITTAIVRGGMTNTSISSGLVLSGTSIYNIINSTASATGEIAFAANPANLDTITINDGTTIVVFTFGDGTGGTVDQTGTAAETMTNLVAAINASALDLTPVLVDPVTVTLIANRGGLRAAWNLTDTGADITTTVISQGVNSTPPSLDTVDKQNTARVGATLLWGNFTTAVVFGAMTNSDLTAGVAPAPDSNGAFGNDAVVSTSLTGGNSSFGAVVVNGSDLASNILSDAGFRVTRIAGDVVPKFDVTYDPDDADIDGGVDLENGGVANLVVNRLNSPQVFDGRLRITLVGPGEVRVYDAVGGDNVIDTLVIAGTTAATRITLENVIGGISVGRILTTDDTTVGTITYNGELSGNGNALWLDAGVTTLSLGEYGDLADGGRIGGNVRAMTLVTQGRGTLRVGGAVTALTIVNGNDPLLDDAAAAAADIIAMTIPGAANATTWVYNTTTDRLERWDAVGGGGRLEQVQVLDALGNTLTLTGLAYNGADIIAVADSAWSYAPTVEIGSLADAQTWLTGLAVDSTGQVYAAQNAEMHELDWNLGLDNVVATAIDSNGIQFILQNDGTLRYVDADHTVHPIGVLQFGINPITSINAMDIDSSGTLYFVGTRAGLGGDMAMYTLDVSVPATATNLATEVAALSGVAGLNNPILALCMVIEPNDGVSMLYAIRNTGVNTLSRIELDTVGSTAVVTDIGAVQVDAVASVISGMDVDVAGNILALDHGGGEHKMIRINLVNPDQSWAIGEDDALLALADGLTSTATGELYTVDSDGAGADDSFLYSIGRDRLVQIDTTTGAYTEVGYFRDIYGSYYYQDVEALAFNNGTSLYAILKDRDGMGGASDADDGAALARVATTATGGNVRVYSPTGTTTSPAVLLNAGGVTNDFTAMAVTNDNATIYAIRRNLLDTEDYLVDINTNGTVGGVLDQHVQVNGATETVIIGMGFDTLGNLVAYDIANAGGSGLINLADPTTHVVDAASVGNAQLITTADLLSDDIDAYAIGRSGNAFAYDQDYNADEDLGHYGMTYRSAGELQRVMCFINLTDGVTDPEVALQYLPLSQDLAGTPLSSAVTSMAFLAGEAYVTTEDGRIARYDAASGALRSFAENNDALTVAGTAVPGSTMMVKITLDPANTQHLSWAVGDVLQDSVGAGANWIGTIAVIRDTHTFDISLSVGAVADVTVANGIERRYNVPAIGTVVDSVTGETLHVTKMDFDDGVLIGIESRYNRLVTITPDFAGRIAIGKHSLTAESRTEAGSVDAADLTALAADDTAGAGVLYTFSDTDNQFKSFAGTTQRDLGGLTLGSVGTLILGGGAQPYQGRIVATGNTFQRVIVYGGFDGILYTTSTIGSYTQTGNFSGALFAGDSMGTVSIGGALLDGGLLSTPGYLSYLRVVGALSGGVMAGNAGRIQVGSLGTTADARINGTAGLIWVAANVAGSLDVGLATNLTVLGGLAASADVHVRGNAGTVWVAGGTAAGSLLKVDGYVGNLTVQAWHQGVIGVDHGARNVRFGSLWNGVASIGQNVDVLYVMGTSTSSVISIGTTIGADGVYNTADDRITGGSLRIGVIRGDFTNSALVAGVLPKLADGGPTNNIPADKRAYTGNTKAASIEDFDSAECGGVLPSVISRVIFSGSTGTGVNTSAIAAETLGTITRLPWYNLYEQAYTDPIGAPEYLAAETISGKEVRYVFSQEINTASFILSQDTDGDGDVTGVSDVLGTVLFRNAAGDVLNDVVLSYTTRLDGGVMQGVLIARRETDTGMAGVLVTFSEGVNYPDPVVYGRSGLRSCLLDLPSEATYTMAGGNPG